MSNSWVHTLTEHKSLTALYTGTKSHQWQGFCLFLVVTLCNGKFSLSTNWHWHIAICVKHTYELQSAMQPVIWLLLGIIALVKISLGKTKWDKLMLRVSYHASKCYLHADYLLIIAVAVVLSSANVVSLVVLWIVLELHQTSKPSSVYMWQSSDDAVQVGYTKCSKQASAQLKAMARNAMTSGLTVRLGSYTRCSALFV